ncbi:patatin-like phospholipase family protein [Paraburkholderia aromaticivorans]|uniref:patatin-like phospholipase family protein n=1 Tax=Paraburkholderia aromaticivorans TaxID=2026199 RepID=UPI001455E99D|nr:patatin-like phospholipase family protein [Paraburkholderia aromaticivorans]
MSANHCPPIAADNPSVGRALVLAGGGMRVAYQAGAVKALIDEGLRFSHADGASGGTINLAALLSGVPPDELCARWRALPVKEFAALRPAPEYLHIANMSALGSAAGLTEHVYPALGVSIDLIRAAIGIDGSFNACCFDDKTVVPIPHPQLDLQRLVAAASLPIFMPAVKANGKTWTDAVWIKDANLLSCVERGARELWLVWCIGNTPVYRNGAFNQYVHMIEMSATGSLNRELETIADFNRRIAGGEVVFGHDQPITVHVIKPECPLPLDPDFYLGRIDAATLIDMGYRDARRTIRLGTPSPLNPSASAMREPGVGLSFRETMAGGFRIGATDPLAVESDADTSPLTMNATIHIDDMAAFIADPRHLGGLTGHIDFTPFGLAMPSESGLFGLFTPSDDPRLTCMIYEIGFRHAGQPYYLAGKKLVNIGSPFRMWGETTTLYTTLHQGSDASGPVVGAGVLHLGVPQLLRLMHTVHATNAQNSQQAAHAIWRFFRFFVSELWRSYIRRSPT